MHIHNFYLSDDEVADVDGVTADAGIDGPRTESQRTTGVGETDELGRRWHTAGAGCPALHVARSAQRVRPRPTVVGGTVDEDGRG